MKYLVLLLPFFMIGCVSPYEEEIDNQTYEALNKIYEYRVEIRPTIHAAMMDGKVTFSELEQINKLMRMSDDDYKSALIDRINEDGR